MSIQRLSRNLFAFADHARAGPLIQDTNSRLYTFKCVSLRSIYATTYMTHLTLINEIIIAKTPHFMIFLLFLHLWLFFL